MGARSFTSPSDHYMNGDQLLYRCERTVGICMMLSALVGTCGYIWVSVGICGYLWVSVGICGYLWVSA
jgi:hypothetical protein